MTEQIGDQKQAAATTAVELTSASARGKRPAATMSGQAPPAAAEPKPGSASATALVVTKSGQAPSAAAAEPKPGSMSATAPVVTKSGQAPSAAAAEPKPGSVSATAPVAMKSGQAPSAAAAEPKPGSVSATALVVTKSGQAPSAAAAAPKPGSASSTVPAAKPGSDAASASPVFETRHAVLRYTTLRLALFVAALVAVWGVAVLFKMDLSSQLSKLTLLAVALLLSSAVSFIVLSKYRDAMSAGIVDRTQRLTKKFDDAASFEDDEDE